MCFSPDGRHIAVGMSRGDVMLWNVRTGRLVERLLGHRSGVYALSFSSDGTGLFSGGRDRTVRFWNIISLGIDHLQNNKVNIVINTDPHVWKWDHHMPVVEFITDSDLYTSTDFFFPKDEINGVSMSANGRWLLSSSSDATICIYDAHNPALLCQISRRKDDGYSWNEFSMFIDYIVSVSPMDNQQLLLWQYQEI